MRDDASVVALVELAKGGDKGAWDRIVERYAPLIWAMCRRYRLSEPDADDVGATVWLRLVERLNTIREPAALPGWIVTTTRNECLGVLRAKRKQILVDTAELPDETDPPPDEWLLTQERHIALRVAFRALSERCRQLLSLLFSDPPMPYIQIAATVGIPVGAIGPSRMRCLNMLRRSPGLASLSSAFPAAGTGRSG
jgi:RNA polymerase sigma factor (sigma-70 family)